MIQYLGRKCSSDVFVCNYYSAFVQNNVQNDRTKNKWETEHKLQQLQKDAKPLVNQIYSQ